MAVLVLAAFAVLPGVGMPLVGSVRRLGPLAPRSIVARCQTPRTSGPGCRGLAARGARSQRHPMSRSRHSRVHSGVLHDQPKSNPDERAEQRTYYDQALAATAKRSLHKASEGEHTPYVAEAPRAQTWSTGTRLHPLTSSLSHSPALVDSTELRSRCGRQCGCRALIGLGADVLGGLGVDQRLQHQREPSRTTSRRRRGAVQQAARTGQIRQGPSWRISLVCTLAGAH